MIDYKMLRILVLEILKGKPETQIETIIDEMHKLATEKKIFPTAEECKKVRIDYSYYSRGMLNPIDEALVRQIIWDLIIDRILTVGNTVSNANLPFLRLTEYGKRIVNKEEHIYYDPDGYIKQLRTIIPDIDSVILQYIEEAIKCFRQHLYFASAVMFGAASEKVIFLLLKTMEKYEKKQETKKEISQLIEYTRIPKIFGFIENYFKKLIKDKIIPYSIHQGCLEHMLSLFEMIRVFRNDAVHIEVMEININKIELISQGFPAAVESVYRLVNWMNNIGRK